MKHPTVIEVRVMNGASIKRTSYPASLQEAANVASKLSQNYNSLDRYKDWTVEVYSLGLTHAKDVKLAMYKNGVACA